MGLIERGTSPSGEPSRVLNPNRSFRRLPWFRGGLAGVIGLAGVYGITPSVFADPLPQSTETTRLVTTESSTVNPLTLELSERVTQEIVKPLVDQGIDIDLTGELLTNAWIDDQGNRNILYRNIWFQVGMDGRLTVVDALDRLNKQGLDDRLDLAFYGDPVPPKQDNLIEVGEEIKQFIQSLKNILNLNIGSITGYRNYGPFEVYRTDKIAVMRILEGDRANQLEFTNIGYQALVAGLIPREYALFPLPFATGGGGPVSPEITNQYPFKAIYQGRALTIINPQNEKGEPTGDFGIKVTDQDKFDQIDKILSDNGLNITFSLVRSAPDKEFNWDIAVCPDPSSNRCLRLRYINFREKPNPDGKGMTVELGLGDASKTTTLTPEEKAYLNNQNLLENIGLFAGELKYGTHVAYISNPTVKAEADAFVNLIADIGTGSLEFVLPSAPLG